MKASRVPESRTLQGWKVVALYATQKTYGGHAKQHGHRCLCLPTSRPRSYSNLPYALTLEGKRTSRALHERYGRTNGAPSPKKVASCPAREVASRILPADFLTTFTILVDLSTISSSLRTSISACTLFSSHAVVDSPTINDCPGFEVPTPF